MMSAQHRVLSALLLVLLAGGISLLPVADWLTQLVAWSRERSIAGPAAYMLFVAIATVLFFPGSMAMMIGGFLFGFLPGLCFAAVAIPTGAQGAFGFGRFVFRPWIRGRVTDDRRLRLVERALNEKAFLIVLLTRLSLIIPFNLLNYAYGATSVKPRIYFAATALGMLPAIALFVYLGTLANDLSQILSGQAAPLELGYWLLLAGAIAIAVTIWVIQRTASRVLEKHLEDQVALDIEE